MTPYAAGKASADLMVRAYQETFGVRVLTLRPFNNYGPRQNDGLYAGVIPITMARLLRGEPPIIHGTGGQTRDFLFVRDTTRIAVELAKREKLSGQVLNLGSGVEVSIEELVGRICRIAGYAGPVATAPSRPGDVLRQRAAVHAVRGALGEIPVRPLEDGLIETWDWYRSRAGKPKRSLAPSAL
jgi:UDP-glucose 4-epimerase